MNTDLASIIALIILLTLYVFVVFYTGYMYWFKPEQYTDRLVKGIKDWMPFSNYFRSHYKSSLHLWIMRLASLFFMALIAFLLIRMMLSFTGVLP